MGTQSRYISVGFRVEIKERNDSNWVKGTSSDRVVYSWPRGGQITFKKQRENNQILRNNNYLRVIQAYLINRIY